MDDGPARLAQAHRLIDDEPAAATGTIGRLQRLCTALNRALPASGIALSLLTADQVSGGTLAASDAQSRALEDLQFTLGEGPCIDAYTSRRPVLEPDLPAFGLRRWPGFAPAAHARGVRAVFAFPLQVGAARAGAMDVYRDVPGSLTPASLAQAFTFAEVAMGLLVDGQVAGVATSTTTVVEDALAQRLEVYQAQGMTMVDLGVGIDEAMARLRGHAFAEGRSVDDVAKDVVAGKLRLDRDTT